ncbi:MAG: FecR domain-containing protein [Cytophagales bacterium]|nr:FecR domain-containing protein [Cytophagales bacterium]
MNPELIKKYLRGRCTRSEEIELLEWIDSIQANKSFGDELIKSLEISNDQAEDFDLDRLHDKLKERLNIEQLITSLKNSEEERMAGDPIDLHEYYSQSKRSFRNTFTKIAAAILLLLSAGFAIYSGFLKEKESLIAVEDDRWVLKKTGRGQRLTSVLPDGSKVILNYNTELKYPGAFSDSIRMIELTGEAYFDVVRDANKPFVVDAGDLKVRVLGTLFAVSSRQGDRNSAVSLVSGKVEVGAPDQNRKDFIAMSPGEAVVFDGLTDTFERYAYIPDHFISWTDDIISFTEASYEEVCGELENWFDVVISTKGPIPSWKFTATFEKENLVNILEGISRSQKIKYELMDKKVTIYTKK